MDVSCRASRMLLEASEHVGLSVEAIAASTTFSLAHLLDVRQRVDWATWAALNQRALDLLGDDPARLEALGDAIARAPSGAFLRAVGRHVASPMTLFEIGARWVSPAMFPQVPIHTQRLDDDRLEIRSTLAPELADAEAFFRICAATLAAHPRAIGLDRALVEGEIGPRGVRLVVTSPRASNATARLRRMLSALRGDRPLVALLDRQRREVEEGFRAASRANEEFRHVLEELPVLVLVHREGRILWLNRALSTLLGYDNVEALIGRSNLDVVHPDDRARTIDQMRPPRQGETREPRARFRLVGRDGIEVVAEVAPAQVVMFGGAEARLVAARDVTEQARMEQQLLLADRMASLGVLAAGVAHEVNNPLAYAIGNVEIAQARLSSGEVATVGAALATALEGLTRVRGIVRDLKTFSRGGEASVGAVDVRAVLESTLTLAGKEIDGRARIVRALEPTPFALGNAARLGQVFLALIVNALDALPASRTAENLLRISLARGADDTLVVEVEDNGEGMSPDVARRVFEPFFTTKPVGSGTGLGLAICHQLVVGMSGTIAVRSTPSVGTRFTLILRAAPPDA
ncbi:MAG: nitrogen regulation protein NR(II), partial [Polyangiales bacterium]